MVGLHTAKAALPREKTPPSDATSQYPPPSDMAAMPTMGALSALPPIDWKAASPKEDPSTTDSTVSRRILFGTESNVGAKLRR